MPSTMPMSASNSGFHPHTPITVRTLAFNETAENLARKRSAAAQLEESPSRDSQTRPEFGQKEITIDTCLEEMQDSLANAISISIRNGKAKTDGLRALQAILHQYIHQGSVRHTENILNEVTGKLTQIANKLSKTVLSATPAGPNPSGEQNSRKNPNPASGSNRIQNTAQTNIEAQNQNAGTPDFYGAPAPNAQDHQTRPDLDSDGFQKVTYAKRAQTNPNQPPQGGKTPQNPKNKTSNKQKLVLLGAVFDSTKSPLALRDHVNNMFNQAKIEKPVISAISRSMNGNLVLTTSIHYTASWLLQNQETLKQAITYNSALLDTPWHKVVVHGVIFGNFHEPNNLEEIKKEIEQFNSVKLLSTPYWLKKIEDRTTTQECASVVISFATAQEAEQAIRKKISVGGKICKAVRMWQTSRATQCNNCQKYGHKEEHCPHPPACQICAQDHSTSYHKCSFCSVKGKACAHTKPKCVNCPEEHSANSRECSVRVALLKPTLPTGSDW